MLGSELSTGASQVNVSWVKGNAQLVDIERGGTSNEDTLGNDGADALAVAGAHSHRVSAEVVTTAKRRKKEWAVAVQRMMLFVMEARLAAESAGNIDAGEADRGFEI